MPWRQGQAAGIQHATAAAIAPPADEPGVPVSDDVPQGEADQAVGTRLHVSTDQSSRCSKVW